MPQLHAAQFPRVEASASTLPCASYVDQRPQVFGSALSLRNFIRRHWARLLRAGAIVPDGQWCRINVHLFDEEVRALGRMPGERLRDS